MTVIWLTNLDLPASILEVKFALTSSGLKNRGELELSLETITLPFGIQMITFNLKSLSILPKVRQTMKRFKMNKSKYGI